MPLRALAVSLLFLVSCGSDDPSGTPDPNCGNGIVEGSETCDDEGESTTCNVNCTVRSCGDGVVNASAGETCDDEGESITCDEDCTAVACGDDIVNTSAGEDCDDAGDTANCDADCTAVTCGDGYVNSATEECDDGGTATNDGCNNLCDEDSGYSCTGSPSICTPTDFSQPPNTVELGFAIDDSINQTYTLADGLAWKGGFTYDAATRIMTIDGGWAGPFALLWDDGPWDTGGHEPAGATADDHIWSVAVFVTITSSPALLEYGAIRGSIAGSDGAWIWNNPANGTVTIPASSSTPVTAVGMTIPAFGTIDLRLTIDSSNLDSSVTAPGTITVKGSAWAWLEIIATDDGANGDETASDGIYTFVLSANVGAGTSQPHTGLLNSGDAPEFVFVLDMVEYRFATGVAAALMPEAVWIPTTVQLNGTTNTPYVDVP